MITHPQKSGLVLRSNSMTAPMMITSYLVISDPAQPEIVIVNMTTRRRWSDTSCIIQPDEHPFVAHETCVAYNFAEAVLTEELEEKLKTGEISPRYPVPGSLMMRVWDGAAMTRHLPLRCVEILRSQGVI